MATDPIPGSAPIDTRRPADDLHLMVLLWQRKQTRDVALDLADTNREAANGRR
jgi:hypothetical protein